MMKKTKLNLIFAAFLALAALPSQANDTDHPAAACPSQDFSSYIQSFANNAAVQQAHTSTPLRMIALVDAEPEPRPETRWLGLDQIRFPLMPTIDEQKRMHLSLRINASSRHVRNVRLSGSDTGYLVKYRFEYRSNCWKLVSVDDQSL